MAFPTTNESQYAIKYTKLVPFIQQNQLHNTPLVVHFDLIYNHIFFEAVFDMSTRPYVLTFSQPTRNETLSLKVFGGARVSIYYAWNEVEYIKDFFDIKQRTDGTSGWLKEALREINQNIQARD